MAAAANTPLQIAYVTPSAPGDVSRWSGTTHYIGKSLAEQGASVHHLGPFDPGQYWWYHLKFQYYRLVRRQTYLSTYDLHRARRLGRMVGQQVARLPAEVVLGSFGDLLAFAETSLPMAVWTDGTFRRMQDFYPYYKNLCAETQRSGLWIDETLLRRCRLAIFSSDWAAKSALADYQLDPARVKVVPFGANIECQRTSREVATLIAARPASPVKLLFIGRIWERKGGDLALAVARHLNEAGTPAELTLVGSGPERTDTLPPYVKPLGFISKATVAGRKQLDQLLAESHFLIVPSRAEAYGIVFCEASSFGLPSLATNVGGIPTIIREGANGRTFPLDAPAAAYVEFISGLMRNYAGYRHLAMQAFAEYERRLNWTAAAGAVRGLLEELRGAPAAGQAGGSARLALQGGLPGVL